MNKGRTTQDIVNAFPSWSNTRTDEQSLGFQLLNVIGNRLDDLKEQEAKAAANRYLPTAICSDIDVYYSCQLNKDYEFTKETNDNTKLIYTPPTVVGIIKQSEEEELVYEITIADNNSIENFWYNAIPNRISLQEIIDKEPYILANGLISETPIPILVPSGIVFPTNKLSVEIINSSSCLKIENNNQIRIGTVLLQGTNREGLNITEELVFPHDEILHTYHEFATLNNDGIRVYGIENANETTIIVKSIDYNTKYHPNNYQELDVTPFKEPMPTYWAIGHSDIGYTTLDLCKYQTDDIEIRIAGYADKYPFLQQELLDNNLNNITAKDLAVEPFSHKIWVIDNDYLYLYSSDIPYFDMSKLKHKDYQAYSVIRPSSYYAVRGDTIELDYLWVRPTKSLWAYRIWVQKPDGTKYSLENGTEVAYHTDDSSWNYGEPSQRQIKATDIFTLDQRGDYIYSLEVKYSDGTQTIDQRIVSVLYQTPLVSLPLSDINNYDNVNFAGAKGIAFDSEYKLWILDNNNVQYQINLHYDKMLIDFNKKIIYLREYYDQIRIKK